MKLKIGCLDAYKQGVKHLQTIDPFTGKTVKFKSKREVDSWIAELLVSHHPVWKNFSLHGIGKIHSEMTNTQSNDTCVMTSIYGSFYYLFNIEEIQDFMKTIPLQFLQTELYITDVLNQYLQRKFDLKDILLTKSFDTSFSFKEAKKLVMKELYDKKSCTLGVTCFNGMAHTVSLYGYDDVSNKLYYFENSYNDKDLTERLFQISFGFNVATDNTINPKLATEIKNKCIANLINSNDTTEIYKGLDLLVELCRKYAEKWIDKGHIKGLPLNEFFSYFTEYTIVYLNPKYTINDFIHKTPKISKFPD